MGGRATSLFNEFGIRTVVGISGSIDSVIGKLSTGELKSGESTCKPGAGKGYGIEKDECDHENEEG